MSENKTKFNESTLGKTSSMDDDASNESGVESFANGFSTIDLNGGGQSPALSQTVNSSYTSFGEAMYSTQLNGSTQSEYAIKNCSSDRQQRADALSSASFNTFNGRNSTPSTSTIFSASDASLKLASKTASTFETIKQWTRSAYKCSRQIVSERLGKSSRTVDPELDLIIENIRETWRRYDQLLFLSRTLAQNFNNVITTQKMLADSFSTLSQKSLELNDEFSSNCETQKNLARNGEILLSSINLFVSSLNTMCTKTIEDTLQTVRNYEGARLEYDAYRYDMEVLSNSPHSEQKIQQTQQLDKDLQLYKEKYERLKNDVLIKSKFLDENRIKVMRKQLILFQTATAAYYSNNSKEIEETLKQFNISTSKLSQSSNEDLSEIGKSFLEQKI